MTTVEISEPGTRNIRIYVETHPTEKLAEPSSGNVHIHLDGRPTEKLAEETAGSSLIELLSKFVAALLGMLEVLEAAPAAIALVCAVIL
jgi:hypothetical protein